MHQCFIQIKYQCLPAYMSLGLWSNQPFLVLVSIVLSSNLRICLWLWIWIHLSLWHLAYDWAETSRILSVWRVSVIWSLLIWILGALYSSLMSTVWRAILRWFRNLLLILDLHVLRFGLLLLLLLLLLCQQLLLVLELRLQLLVMLVLLDLLLLEGHLLLLKLQLVLVLLVWNLNWHDLAFLLHSSAAWVILLILAWLFLLEMWLLWSSHAIVFFVIFWTSHDFFVVSVINIFRSVLMTNFMVEIIVFERLVLRRFRISFAHFLNIRLFQTYFCIVVWICSMMGFLNFVASWYL